MTPERWEQIKPLLSAALDRPPAERAALLTDACAGDAALRAELESLIAAHEEAGAFLDTPAVPHPLQVAEAPPDTSQAGLRIGPYEVVRELGHGGMGVVYLAARADHAYDKQVAIKLVRGAFVDAYLAERFRDERQILASLNHPCIAHLLDGGTTPDGMPYLVMEHVEGEPIDAYCEQRGLSTRQRLALFRQVCDAVHYAHRNLVIHRDLKPSNILVTPEGTPKLLDFGIAKLVRRDMHAEATVRSFTPDYASPEQVRGEPITTASDVYTLGVLLYFLLTQRKPYRVTDDPLEQARVICEDEPAEPRTVARDLDTIVLKALRKEPERRYSSVEQFSTDIGRYLNGLPVLAAPDTLRYRAAKFVRRHTLGVASAAALFLMLAGATGVTTWQARVANRERERAEHRFNDVRQLATSVVGELHDAIKDLNGATPARKLLVTRAVEYLDRLATESAGNASLQRELAGAYAKMGDAQGNPYLANLGDRAGAMRSYQKAFELHSALAAGSPSDMTSAPGRRRRSRAHCRHAVGGCEVRRRVDGIPGGVRHLRKACRREPDKPGRPLQRVAIAEPDGATADERRRAARRVGSLPPIVGVDGRIDRGRSGQHCLPPGSRGRGPEDRRRRGSVARLPHQLRRLCAGRAHRAAAVTGEPRQRRLAQNVRARARAARDWPPEDRPLGRGGRPRTGKRSTSIARWRPPIRKTCKRISTWPTPTRASATR